MGNQRRRVNVHRAMEGSPHQQLVYSLAVISEHGAESDLHSLPLIITAFAHSIHVSRLHIPSGSRHHPARQLRACYGNQLTEIMRDSPVIKLESGPARKATPLATSSTVTRRPNTELSTRCMCKRNPAPTATYLLREATLRCTQRSRNGLVNLGPHGRVHRSRAVDVAIDLVLSQLLRRRLVEGAHRKLGHRVRTKGLVSLHTGNG